MSGISVAAIIFFSAMGITLVITPRIASWASRRGICDYPSSRRVHASCIPRAGGIALFISFVITYSVSLAITSEQGLGALLNREQFFFLLGATSIFSLGLWDDINRLSPWVKFSGQIAVGLLVWYGGIDVELLSVTLYKGISLPSWLSLVITVFWVVLLVNAINLIDGLDGLAAGICLFVSLTLLSLCFTTGKPMLVIGFSVLAGSCLGFLRYNFNPASIFMGDCGSYLLGYLLAALTIQGAMKSHAAVALLIPVIALGVPLLDTLLAPVRRFVLGKKMFLPDQSHIHHILLKLGYSQRHVVVIIYGITIFLGLTALAFVFVKDQLSAYILAIPGIIIFLAVKKLGYLEYVAADKIWGWLRDITDEAGFSNERRSFLNIQMQIMQSGTVEELWNNVTVAIEKLDFDMAELHFNSEEKMLPVSCGMTMKWQRDQGNDTFDFNEQFQFKLEMPLMADQEQTYGILWLIKDLKRSNMSHYTLRRVEHLRRTIIGVLSRFAGL
ncbi:MAG: MraY family glycosyltransferase [Thermodesulfobacteriota bacterium]|nr:MraY family glycosyltransferase [Thermodesulfobacteriota bacterium]